MMLPRPVELRQVVMIKGVAMVSDEEAWTRNKHSYNLMDIQREAEVAKSAQAMNADELKYPSDFYAVMRLMKRHGDVKLSKILATFSPLGFICPQCNGTGTVRESMPPICLLFQPDVPTGHTVMPSARCARVPGRYPRSCDLRWSRMAGKKFRHRLGTLNRMLPRLC